jgi:hypothetical protein
MNTPNHAHAPAHAAPAKNTNDPAPRGEPHVRCPSATSGDNLFLGPTWPETKFGRFMVTGFGRLLASAARGTEFIRTVGVEVGATVGTRSEDDTLARWIDHKGWPARPLQVGVYQSGGWADDLVSADGVFRPEWNETTRPVFATHTDVLVRRSDDGGILIQSRERTGREAAWFDWSCERPFSYPSVFPVRFDATQATLAPDALGNTDPLITRLLIEAAALCSRLPERLTLDDRINGRNVGWSRFSARTTVEGLPITLHHHADTDPLTLVMRALTEAVASADQTTRTSPAARAAARVLSAWAVSASGVEPSLVRAAAETAWDVNKSEVETALRVAAVRLAQLDDPAGLAALEFSASLLREKRHAFAQEQVDFVVSELKTQSNTPEGVARVAAGVVLVASTFPPEHLRHFKEDLQDDAKLSGALVGQDQDTHLILQVFRMLERRAGIQYIPAHTLAWSGSIEPRPSATALSTLTPPGFTFPAGEVTKSKRVRAKKGKSGKATKGKSGAKSGKSLRFPAKTSPPHARRKAA